MLQNRKNKPSSIEQFVERFCQALKTETASKWEQADIICEVRKLYGTGGVKELAKASGLSLNWMRQLAALARQVPAGTRKKYAHLPFSTFRTAVQVASRFPDTSEKSSYVWWLEQVEKNSWSNNKLRKVAAKYSSPAPKGSNMTDRMKWLEKRALEAGRAHATITELVESFNRDHASYFGFSLKLQTIVLEHDVAV